MTNFQSQAHLTKLCFKGRIQDGRSTIDQCTTTQDIGNGCNLDMGQKTHAYLESQTPNKGKGFGKAVGSG